ncbi:MAG: hypothetical protein HC889_01615 [Synechococcaceae cyanobacterium SM1_2_3]|nr:hypothetical protein [Synechococcaceae cyanobacterium SM1_2_3]
MLWDKAKHTSLQKRYALLFGILKVSNPFLDWCVEQRYYQDGIVSVEAMKKHQVMAKRLLGAVGLTGQRK